MTQGKRSHVHQVSQSVSKPTKPTAPTRLKGGRKRLISHHLSLNSTIVPSSSPYDGHGAVHAAWHTYLPKDAADVALLEPTKGHVKPPTVGVGEDLTRLQLVGHLGGPVFVARPNAATQPVPTYIFIGSQRRERHSAAAAAAAIAANPQSSSALQLWPWERFGVIFERLTLHVIVRLSDCIYMYQSCDDADDDDEMRSRSRSSRKKRKTRRPLA